MPEHRSLVQESSKDYVPIVNFGFQKTGAKTPSLYSNKHENATELSRHMAAGGLIELLCHSRFTDVHEVKMVVERPPYLLPSQEVGYTKEGQSGLELKGRRMGRAHSRQQ